MIHAFAALVPFVLASSPVAALGDGSTYLLPPKEIVDLLDAPPTPQGIASPDGERMLFVERPSMPSIAEVTRPWIPLAGLRVDPELNATQQLSFASGLYVKTLPTSSASSTSKDVRIELPVGARIMTARWSHAGGRIAITIAGERAVELWMADATTGVARKLVAGVNALFGAGFDWTGDGERLLVALVPAKRGAAPAESRVPTGPAVQETAGTKTALRTYQDLLSNARDEALFEHYARTQLAIVDPTRDAPTLVGEPGLYASFELSPDDRWILVERVHRPFSYVLPADLFPTATEVWDASGKLARTIVDAPLGESIPQEGVRTGPRNVRWNASEPATLVWCEALDGGDPKTKAEWRDEWKSITAPFRDGARSIAKLHQRAQGITFFATPERFLASEYDRDRRWTRTLLFDATKPGAEPIPWDDRSVNDRYGDPGALVTTVDARGQRVVRQDGAFVYRSGRGASKDGEQPFLDRVDTTTLKTERLWRCAKGTYEAIVDVQRTSAGAKPRIVTSYESPTEPPNYRVRDLETDVVVALTRFPDPQPALRGITQELVKYARKDGVELSGTLYLPAHRKEGERLPLFVWAYPLEYSDAATAGQVSGSPFRFVRVRGASQLLFAAHGWAVLDNATMPIVGDPETMNDTFVEQIVAASQAAIDFCVERGVADRERVAVGGHSYGAFMTANLLAHCDLFRAGVARSGAYNRTLTPFGFQSERRTLWEAPRTYIELSPFLAANEIDEPLLLIHGEKDSNQGTFPIQSERLYQAIKGNGGIARLVMLPGEAHGYSARESVLDTVAEMFAWCDRWVRDAKPRAKAGSVEATPATAPAAR